MTRKRIIRNVGAVSLGTVALALCALPHGEDGATKRAPMPSPEKHGGKPARDIATRQIPVPDFGPEPGGVPASPATTTARFSAAANAAGDRQVSTAQEPPLPRLAETVLPGLPGSTPQPPAVPDLSDAAPDLPQAAVVEPLPPPADVRAEAGDVSPGDPPPAQSNVKVWDFATGRPLPDVLPAGAGQEVNDNQPVALADVTPDVAPPEQPPAVPPPPMAAAPVANAVTPAKLAQAPGPIPPPTLAVDPAPVEPEISAPVPPSAASPTPVMAPAATPVVASATPDAPGLARVWDFASGRPLSQVAAATGAVEADHAPADAAPPLAGKAAPAPEQAAKAELPTAPVAQPSAVSEAVAGPAQAGPEKVRVWDFASGRPIAAAVTPDVRPDPAPDSVAKLSTGAAWQPGTTARLATLSPQDELILEVKVKGVDAADTIIAYGTQDGIYLPLGALARILDLAVTVSDGGKYAHGWVLEEGRPLTIDLNQALIEFKGERRALPDAAAATFDGELYLRVDQFPGFLPIRIAADLRMMAVQIETLEPFPFELRAKREAQRQRLASRQGEPEVANFERVDLPWVALSVPAADVELRAVSDSTFGERLEGDLRLAGDLGFLTAEAYLSGETKNGLTASLLELGRVDPDGNLLGPLSATAFSVGDTSTETMPLGLRSVAGRGFAVTNAATQMASVFDRVDLRSILPAGYEVELYRNDILIGSTRDAVNGQYEFLQVPVDFGLNVFRLVFFGPQGQRSETVRRISVGDGRVSKGQLVYSFGAAQKDRNVLGVEPPNFAPQSDYGSWRAGGQLAYGVTSGLTGVLSGAFFEREGDRWVSSAGLRTSLGGVAVRADVGAADGGALAFSGGLGGRVGGSAITLSHAEYSGLFPDETKASGLDYLRRATELDFNTTLKLGPGPAGLAIPLSARVRRYVDADGNTDLQAGLRASTRAAGLLLSNTLDYSRTSSPGAGATSQLLGNFDLATLGRSDTRARFSLGYRVLPDADLTSAAIEVDHVLDEQTSLRGSASYDFASKSPSFGVSAAREFDRFRLALDGNYSVANDTYYVGLRLGFSLGRDPVSKRMFVARPGQATGGGAALRAFQDMDGDGVYGPTDKPLPAVDFVAFNQTVTTDKAGVAMLGGLGTGREIAIQIDKTSLPDIALAPAKPGIELVPRPGRLHAVDYPVVALSEVEGTARFVSDGKAKGVSGVRLNLTEVGGKVVGVVRTELDGYFFFEQVPPGRYRLTIEPDQATRLNLCAADVGLVTIGYEAEVVARDIDIKTCETPQPVLAQARPEPQSQLADASGASD